MARRLGVSERTLRSWRSARIVPFIKIRKAILFDPDAVETALKRFERTVTGV
jgi:helix-turn-helix protein